MMFIYFSDDSSNFIPTEKFKLCVSLFGSANLISDIKTGVDTCSLPPPWDEDQCSTGTHNCGPDQNCIDQAISFRCEMKIDSTALVACRSKNCIKSINDNEILCYQETFQGSGERIECTSDDQCSVSNNCMKIQSLTDVCDDTNKCKRYHEYTDSRNYGLCNLQDPTTGDDVSCSSYKDCAAENVCSESWNYCVVNGEWLSVLADGTCPFNECLAGEFTCGENQYCVDQDEGYKCEDKVDECSLNLHNCGIDQDCVDKDVGFECVFKEDNTVQPLCISFTCGKAMNSGSDMCLIESAQGSGVRLSCLTNEDCAQYIDNKNCIPWPSTVDGLDYCSNGACFKYHSYVSSGKYGMCSSLNSKGDSITCDDYTDCEKFADSCNSRLNYCHDINGSPTWTMNNGAGMCD